MIEYNVYSKFTELSLASSRNFLKISAKVCLMTADSSLTQLNISNTSLSYTASKLLGHLVKVTTRLEKLNMANCGLRSSSAKEIANSLLFNQTIKFLNLSVNNFGSKDHELASKLARMIQVHVSLVHVDLSNIGVMREEAMYIA
jgi:Ran GTPase-activating protein (RanGAP) involved in mRNA processing and transport